MRAGTPPWLRPKLNSVDVVKMMVEGEKKEMRAKEWASEACRLAAIVILRPQCQRGCRVSEAAGGHTFCHFP